MTLEHVALVWQQGVGFGFKAGVGVGIAVGLLLAWLWNRWAGRRYR
jgi:hypothetical protein